MYFLDKSFVVTIKRVIIILTKNVVIVGKYYCDYKHYILYIFDINFIWSSPTLYAIFTYKLYWVLHEKQGFVNFPASLEMFVYIFGKIDY